MFSGCDETLVKPLEYETLHAVSPCSSILMASKLLDGKQSRCTSPEFSLELPTELNLQAQTKPEKYDLTPETPVAIGLP